jgi:predicted transcriptional regulator
MSARQKENASVAVTTKALRKHETQSPERNARSTTTQAQRDRVLAALKRRPQTTEDLRKLGIFQTAARVKELRDHDGHHIDTSLVTLYDREGFVHRRAARYALVTGAEGASK